MCGVLFSDFLCIFTDKLPEPDLRKARSDPLRVYAGTEMISVGQHTTRGSLSLQYHNTMSSANTL
jgi:hypothetical protein